MNVMNTLGGRELKTEEKKLVDRHGNERTGVYMQTALGSKYWPFDPRPEEVHIETIAHHLAGENRWQGAVQHKKHIDRIFYSVAEHSVYVAEYVEKVLKRPDLALEALVHDAPEAFIGDLIRPLKYHEAFRAPFMHVEDLQENVIARRFNLVHPLPKEIKIADDAVTAAESEQIVPRSPDEEWESCVCHENDHVYQGEIQMLLPFQAKVQFLAKYRELIAVRSRYREVPADILTA